MTYYVTYTPALFENSAENIRHYIQDAFYKLTKTNLPEDINITVAPRRALEKMHPAFLDESVMGISFDRQVIVPSGTLEDVLLVIGHELGHVLTEKKEDAITEEAKAFAFELAWAKAIYDHDIGGLSGKINLAAERMQPAKNGLHDEAFAFVKAAGHPKYLHKLLTHNYLPLIKYQSGYLNKSTVHNVPWMTGFTWANLGPAIYGTYNPQTGMILINEALKSNLQEFHKTLGHERILHQIMQLPDGYATKALEDAIFWSEEDCAPGQGN